MALLSPSVVPLFEALLGLRAPTGPARKLPGAPGSSSSPPRARGGRGSAGTAGRSGGYGAAGTSPAAAARAPPGVRACCPGRRRTAPAPRPRSCRVPAVGRTSVSHFQPPQPRGPSPSREAPPPAKRPLLQPRGPSSEAARQLGAIIPRRRLRAVLGARNTCFCSEVLRGEQLGLTQGGHVRTQQSDRQKLQTMTSPRRKLASPNPGAKPQGTAGLLPPRSRPPPLPPSSRTRFPLDSRSRHRGYEESQPNPLQDTLPRFVSSTPRDKPRVLPRPTRSCRTRSCQLPQLILVPATLPGDPDTSSMLTSASSPRVPPNPVPGHSALPHPPDLRLNVTSSGTGHADPPTPLPARLGLPVTHTPPWGAHHGSTAPRVH